MKLIINYDFFERVCDVREPLGPLKIVRNNKRKWIKLELPLYLGINLCFYTVSKAIWVTGFDFLLLTTLNLLPLKILGRDFYAERAINDLTRLSSQLKDLYVNTNPDLLLESELYKRKYNIKFNENKIPYLLESKYILIPTYDYNGEIGETSILQEHVVGSREYILSLGTPQKEFKFAYSGT